MAGILFIPNIVHLLLLIMINASTPRKNLWGYYKSDELNGTLVPELWFNGEKNIVLTMAHNDKEITEPIYASYVISARDKLSISFNRKRYDKLLRDFPNMLINTTFTDVLYDSKANTSTMAVNETTCGRPSIALKHERKVGGYFYNKDFRNNIIFKPNFWGEDDSEFYLAFDNQSLKTVITVKHTISSDWVISFSLTEDQKEEVLAVCPVCFPPRALNNMRYHGPSATISVPINSTFFGVDQLLLFGR